MNDIKRLRLQNQIFRLVATYYQKMSRGQDDQGLALDTRSIDAATRGQDVHGLELDRMSIDAKSRGQDGQSLTLDTMSINEPTGGQASGEPGRTDDQGLALDTSAVSPAATPSTGPVEPTSLETTETPGTTNPFSHSASNDFTRQVKDYCTFTRCELSPDGSFAKIFVSIWGDEKDQARIMKGIQRLVPGMRSSIAKNIRMRAIPHLAFVQDRSFEKGDQVARLI